MVSTLRSKLLIFISVTWISAVLKPGQAHLQDSYNLQPGRTEVICKAATFSWDGFGVQFESFVEIQHLYSAERATLAFQNREGKTGRREFNMEKRVVPSLHFSRKWMGISEGGPKRVVEFETVHDSCIIPFYMPILVLFAWPAIRRARTSLKKLFTRNTAKPFSVGAFCACCGYDLRATPRRCPECGAACEAADTAGKA